MNKDKPMKIPRLYEIWKGMRKRCNSKTNPNYRYYGGRGVKICPAWADFFTFQRWALEHGYRDDLTIDRIDYTGDYAPENCRWITRAEQNKNTRKIKTYTFNGMSMCHNDWARYLGIVPSALTKRIHLHGLDWALKTPKWAYRKPAIRSKLDK